VRGAPHSILACKRHLIINAQKVNTRYCFKLTLVLNLLSYLKHPGTFRTLLAPINNVVVKLIMYCNLQPWGSVASSRILSGFAPLGTLWRTHALVSQTASSMDGGCTFPGLKLDPNISWNCSYVAHQKLLILQFCFWMIWGNSINDNNYCNFTCIASFDL